MQKVRCRFLNFNRLLTLSFKSFHLYKSFFHLSLTVLFYYRLSKIFRIEGGSPKFWQKKLPYFFKHKGALYGTLTLYGIIQVSLICF